MRSLGVRLALLYAFVSTATLAGLVVAGYYLLDQHLVSGLDLLNETEFEQVRASLGPDYDKLSAEEIGTRVRRTTEFASVLFFIEVHERDSGVLFSSPNLNGRQMPDVPGERVFLRPAGGHRRIAGGGIRDRLERRDDRDVDGSGAQGDGWLCGDQPRARVLHARRERHHRPRVEPHRAAAGAADSGNGEPHPLGQLERTHPGVRRAGRNLQSRAAAQQHVRPARIVVQPGAAVHGGGVA